MVKLTTMFLSCIANTTTQPAFAPPSSVSESDSARSSLLSFPSTL